MNARARASIFSISLLGAIFALSTPAWAPGTLGLDEVLAAVKTEPKLVAEIERALQKDGRKADRLTCMGARHGSQWKYLGGARAAPSTIRTITPHRHFDSAAIASVTGTVGHRSG